VLSTVLAVLATAQAPAVTPTVASPAAQSAPVAPKPKPKPKKCDNNEPVLGSHMFMGTCPTDEDLAKAGLRGQRLMKQSLVNGAKPLGAPGG
jgi:hypothetical protein